MRTKILIGLCVSAGVILGGCGSKADDPDATGTSPTTTPTDTEDPSGTVDPSDTEDPSDPSDTEDPSGPSDTTADTNPDPSASGFITDPDGGTGVEIECDVWAQDCAKDQKCMPWANDGGSSWNATRCSALDPNPAQIGDECTAEGGGVSGIDNCELGAMCWNTDDANLGTCIGFCEGSEANPVCPDPSTACAIANGGVLILCLPTCDPLLTDCNEGENCYPIDDSFACAPDAGGEEGVFGDACEFLNFCDPGLYCAAAAAVPNCQGSQGCCSSFCDITEPDASAECPGAAGGQECVPWYEEGQALPGLEDVGGCAIPM